MACPPTNLPPEIRNAFYRPGTFRKLPRKPIVTELDATVPRRRNARRIKTQNPIPPEIRNAFYRPGTFRKLPRDLIVTELDPDVNVKGKQQDNLLPVALSIDRAEALNAIKHAVELVGQGNYGYVDGRFVTDKRFVAISQRITGNKRVLRLKWSVSGAERTNWILGQRYYGDVNFKSELGLLRTQLGMGVCGDGEGEEGLSESVGDGEGSVRSVGMGGGEWEEEEEEMEREEGEDVEEEEETEDGVYEGTGTGARFGEFDG